MDPEKILREENGRRRVGGSMVDNGVLGQWETNTEQSGRAK